MESSCSIVPQEKTKGKRFIIEPKSGKNITENRLSGTKIRFVRQNRSEKPVSKSVQIFAKILYD